jgi:hypothetical protein
MPLYIMTFNILLGIGISFAAMGGPTDDDEVRVTSYTAGSVRLQLILASSVSFVLYIFFPYFLMPKTAISIGTEASPLFFFKEIFPGNVVWCLEIGLVT